MAQTTIRNEASKGTCAKCKKPSDRILTPPLISPPDWHRVSVIGDEATWAPGKEERKYNVVFEGGTMYLRPQDVPNDPICWNCFAESLKPADWPFVVNRSDKMDVWFNS